MRIGPRTASSGCRWKTPSPSAEAGSRPIASRRATSWQSSIIIAGDGWRVSLGRLLAPSDSSMVGYTEDGHPWMYEGPSGDEHSFANFIYGQIAAPDPEVQFSSDGSHLRLVKRTSSTRDVEF